MDTHPNYIQIHIHNTTETDTFFHFISQKLCLYITNKLYLLRQLFVTDLETE